ncbi:hypothetical protein K439DRAFT_1611571 [Ramaria rubella]|nr:hypothetical protein K439DRAFT_1611571 [Ramaria rubella]
MTWNSALHALQRVCAHYPKAGMRDMKLHMLREEGVKVSHVQSIARKVIEEFFLTHEPEGIKERKARHLKRKRFWAASVNDIWAIDQHDKWKWFHLWLHTGVEPYSGKILWLCVWWTNKNPRLILHYYLEAVQELGAMPLVTQSDPRSENYGVANGHTTLRHMFDPSFQGTRQHCWMRKHNTVGCENTTPLDAKTQHRWMRKHNTVGCENTTMLNQKFHGLNYDADLPLVSKICLMMVFMRGGMILMIHWILLFRWLFIPWLQVELDTWKDSHNTAPKRADKNKILPHGRPQLIFKAPHMYDSLDFKVGITPEAVQQVHEHYAPSDDPVFILVPPAFGQLLKEYIILSAVHQFHARLSGEYLAICWSKLEISM